METFASLKKKEVYNKKKLILLAAERVFARESFKKVSIREIAREAGISHATIYRYFPDKQSLFVEAFLRGVRQIEQKIEHILKSSSSPLVEEVARNFVLFLFENDHYFKMMSNFMLEGKVSPHLMDKVNHISRSLLDKIELVLKKEGICEDSRLRAHGFFSALNGILISFYNYPGREKEEIKEHMLRLATLMAKVFSGKGE